MTTVNEIAEAISAQLGKDSGTNIIQFARDKFSDARLCDVQTAFSIVLEIEQADEAFELERGPSSACAPEMFIRAFKVSFPAGTPLQILSVSGSAEFTMTKIRSAPWKTSSGHILVMVEGFAGGKDVRHIEFP